LLCYIRYISELGYRLDIQGIMVEFPAEPRNSSLFQRVQTALGSTQPPIQWVPGTLPLGIKQLRCEPHHSLPSVAKFGMCAAIHYSPHMPSWHAQEKPYLYSLKVAMSMLIAN
jgi:hypothetical protein